MRFLVSWRNRTLNRIQVNCKSVVIVDFWRKSSDKKEYQIVKYKLMASKANFRYYSQNNITWIQIRRVRIILL